MFKNFRYVPRGACLLDAPGNDERLRFLGHSCHASTPERRRCRTHPQSTRRVVHTDFFEHFN
jgi:hypothetical protein